MKDTGRINYSYLNVAKEIPLLIKLELKRARKIPGTSSKKILIINTCLIGEFVSSIPALSSFIKENKGKIDIIVSPPIKPLAEAIKGINKVYTVKSVYNRGIEKKARESLFPGDYNLILVMRISKEAYNLIQDIKFNSIKSYFVPYFSNMLHFAKRLLIKGKVRQWRDVNYRIVGRKDNSQMPKLSEIFYFKKTDYNRIKSLPELKGPGKKILIHTDACWNVKCWNNQNWTELIKKINEKGNFKFVFIGTGKKEEKNFREIQKNLDFKIFSLINRTDLKDLVLVMKLSDYFIGVDSGPRNIANFMGIPSVNLLGPGLKNFMPTNKKDVVIDKSNCRCADLFCYKRKTCMEKIAVDDVFKGFNKLKRASKKHAVKSRLKRAH